MRKVCFSDKRGNVFFEGMTVIYWLLILIIFGIVGLTLFTDMNNDFQADPDNDPDAKQQMQEQYDQYPSMWDDIIIIIFVGLWLFILISAYFVETSPIFFIISIVLLIILLYVTVYIGNGAENIFNDDGLNNEYIQFPKTQFVVENLVLFILAIGATTVLVLFMRKQ